MASLAVRASTVATMAALAVRGGGDCYKKKKKFSLLVIATLVDVVVKD